jgi:hypothetical protein
VQEEPRDPAPADDAAAEESYRLRDRSAFSHVAPV